MLPFLKLPGIVEMDETYIGKRRYSLTDPFPTVRWVYGMHCRQTKLSILRFIKDKVHTTLAPIIKAHIDPGTVVMSDMHSLYVNIQSNESKLSPYGYYHMWVNHSETMVHDKYRFLHTMNMEKEWNRFKSGTPGMCIVQNQKQLQEYCDNYTVIKCITKKRKLYSMYLKLINYFYYDLLAEYMKLMEFKEDFLPGILNLDFLLRDLKNPAFRNRVLWNFQQEVKPRGQIFNFYNNEDFGDLKRRPEREDID